LFTDPINEVPVVTIQRPNGDIVRGVTADFTVGKLNDDAISTVEWVVLDAVDEGCTGITNASWNTSTPKRLDRNAPYPFKAQTPNVVCLCVRATDSDGAVGQDCARIAPISPRPIAKITDQTGLPSGVSRPLCSRIELSSAGSTYLTDPTYDKVEFTWTLDAPAGTTAQLVECSTVKDPKRRCLSANVPGVYTVTLSIADTPMTPAGGTAGATLTSDPVPYVAMVATDAPPCLQSTDPDMHAQRILLSRSSDLGISYQSRTLKVYNAADDCEPFPNDDTSLQSWFVWSVYDPSSSSGWVYQASTDSSYVVSQADYPKALPGDTIKVRVEVRDKAVQKLYTSGISACASDQTNICCAGGTCTGSNDCIRWTTWTVQFQP
jgi:hypothetical protein